MTQYQAPINREVQRFYNTEGELHRLDGPALILPNGTSYWYLNGKSFDPNSLLFKLEKERCRRKQLETQNQKH